MSDIVGFKGKLAMDPAGGSSYTDITGIKDLSMAVDQQVFDVTDHDSGFWMEHLVGRKQVTLTVTGNYDEADAGQENVLNTAVMAGTMVTWRYRPETGSGKKQYTFSGSVTNVEISSPNEGPAELSFDIQITAAMTRANQ